ncbi:MAG: nucleotide-binding protein [Bacteroidia bacterium]
MTTSRKQVIEPPKTILIKSRNIFKTELQDRISIGNEYVSRIIQTIDDIEQLVTDFGNWHDYNLELIKRAFNKPGSEYYRSYFTVNVNVGVRDYMSGVNTNHPSYKIKETKEKVTNCLSNLNRLIEKLPLIEEESSIATNKPEEKNFFNCGFIVHGHDDLLKLEVARYIEKELRKNTIILQSEVTRGQTIIEKFENNSRVDFAVAIWTSDDTGKSKTESEFQPRARQNVIFETGFFIGALSRKNVIILIEKGIEVPSNYGGIVPIKLEGNWRDDLRKEIEAIYQH